MVVDDAVATRRDVAGQRRRRSCARSGRPRKGRRDDDDDDEGAALSVDKLATTSVEVTGKPMEAKPAALTPSSFSTPFFPSLAPSLGRFIHPFSSLSLSFSPPFAASLVRARTRVRAPPFSRVYMYICVCMCVCVCIYIYSAERLTDTRRG